MVVTAVALAAAQAMAALVVVQADSVGEAGEAAGKVVGATWVEMVRKEATRAAGEAETERSRSSRASGIQTGRRNFRCRGHRRACNCPHSNSASSTSS